jgi:uncharacterized membrane protein YgcG
MKKFWIYGAVVVLVSTVLSWSNLDSSSTRGYRTGGSTWSSNTGGGSWGGGGGHK